MPEPEATKVVVECACGTCGEVMTRDQAAKMKAAGQSIRCDYCPDGPPWRRTKANTDV